MVTKIKEFKKTGCRCKGITRTLIWSDPHPIWPEQALSRSRWENCLISVYSHHALCGHLCDGFSFPQPEGVLNTEYFLLRWPIYQCGQIHSFAGKDTEIIIFRDVPAWIWVASSENVENLILQTYFDAHKPCNYLILAETNSIHILLPALLAEFGNYATYLDFGINGFAVSSCQGLQLAFSWLWGRIGHFQTIISLQHSP